MSSPALVLAPTLAAEARARLEARGATPATVGVLSTAVAAFAAGHPAVLVVLADVPESLLDLAASELSAAMTAVIGPTAGGELALLGVTELVPALLALDGQSAAEALRLASEAGLSLVVLPAA